MDPIVYFSIDFLVDVPNGLPYEFLGGLSYRLPG